MSPASPKQLSAALFTLMMMRKTNPDYPGCPVTQANLVPLVRDPVFEYVADVETSGIATFSPAGGLNPPKAVRDWLNENASGAWTMFFTRDLKSKIAFEHDADRVLYCIRFAGAV